MENIQIAVSRMNIPESKTTEMAEDLLPNLERWKS